MSSGKFIPNGGKSHDESACLNKLVECKRGELPKDVYRKMLNKGAIRLTAMRHWEGTRQVGIQTPDLTDRVREGLKTIMSQLPPTVEMVWLDIGMKGQFKELDREKAISLYGGAE